MKNTLKLSLDKLEIERATKSIIDNTNSNLDDLKTIFSCIDLTSLNILDNNISIKNIVEKVNDFSNIYSYKNIAAICVFPNFAKIVKTNLKNKNINIAVVAGGFPASQTFLSVKIAECDLAVSKGANEVDIVLPLGRFNTEQYQDVFNEIFLIKQTIGKAKLKVILETGLHDSYDTIYHASYISMEAGADFIKTSTGKLQPAATPEAAYVMTKAIKDYHDKTGKKIGFKPAGGISKSEDAIIYYNIVKYNLGEEWLNNRLFRIGASGLANNILSELEDKKIKYF